MVRVNAVQAEKVSSCLTTEKRGMDRIMLEVVAAGLVRTADDIFAFIHHTLLAADYEAAFLEENPEEAPRHECGGDPATSSPSKKQHEWQQRVAETCKTSIFNLVQQGFVFWKLHPAPSRPSDTVHDGEENMPRKTSSEGHWAHTDLAAAALRANISSEEALTVNEDVASVAKHLCLESDLHLMYLVAPVKANETLRWQMVYQVVEHAHNHNPIMQTVCARTGVEMEFARKLGQAKKIGFKPEVRCADSVHLSAVFRVHVILHLRGTVCIAHLLEHCLVAWLLHCGICRSIVLTISAVQKGEYERGKRKSPDKKRQLYKMYIALILTELVNETPLDKIVKMFYPIDNSRMITESAWEAHVTRLEKEISSLQVCFEALTLCICKYLTFVVDSRP